MNSSGNPSPQPPVKEQLVEVVLKVIMTGGIAGGSIGAFWQLFQNSDLPKAIANLVIGLGISYAAKMLRPVDKGNRQRLEETGQALNKQIDKVTNQLIALATGFEDKYLLCQAQDCQSFLPRGITQHDGIFIPLLEEVFVELKLDYRATEAGFTEPVLSKQSELTVWSFLAKARAIPTFRQMVVLAWGGYGKTTLLRHIAFRYGIRQIPKGVPQLTPILIILRKYREILTKDNPPDLPELITQHHIPNLPESDVLQPPSDWAKNLLRNGRALVMFDGFDEVSITQRPMVAEWITTQMRHYGKSIFLLTSRPEAYQKQEAATRLTLTASLWLKGLNTSQINQFVIRWYECQEHYANAACETPDVKKAATKSARDLLSQIESWPVLRDLVQNPLLLNTIAMFHRQSYGESLKDQQVEMYQEICRFKLLDRPRVRRVGTLMTKCDTQRVLQELAYEMMAHKSGRISKEKLLTILPRIIQQSSEVLFDVEDFLNEVVQVSEILICKESEYEFFHPSFQEYLAVAHMIGGKSKRKSNLIDKKITLELQALKKLTFIETHYDALEQYLRKQEWQKADTETYLLMIKILGKKEGQSFTLDELLNFPCQKLQTIDRLWTRYSKGNYGFSIQTEIYLSNLCGGVVNGQFNEKVIRKFGDAVSWRENGSWIYYENLKWKAGPKGHLPVLQGKLEDLYLYGWLFSRLEACKRAKDSSNDSSKFD